MALATRAIKVRVRGQKLQIPFEANILKIIFTHQYLHYVDDGTTAGTIQVTDTTPSVLYIHPREAITLPHLLKPHLSQAPSFDDDVLHDDELDFLVQCVASRVRALTASADCFESFFFLVDVVLVCSEPEEDEEEKAAKGASDSALLKLKKERFDGGDGVCCVCLGEFLASVSVARMPCNHVFHDCCILRWLQRADTCPICRQQLLSD
ncbi:RING-H2 finger protein ATL77-like [Tripterygium wilfordii]|uniref:RING-H2 finger protein ATL77-like n=1 Tax=Tripterygium wilfordii TaxID=458696 RepID=UPI0018F7F7BE|nr:RING-H2 finger protein ATL77-like [Tripterygium wilfordii]